MVPRRRWAWRQRWALGCHSAESPLLAAAGSRKAEPLEWASRALEALPCLVGAASAGRWRLLTSEAVQEQGHLPLALLTLALRPLIQGLMAASSS